MTPDALPSVRRLLDERVPLRMLMEERIATMEREGLATMEREGLVSEPPQDRDALRALDFEGEFLRLGEWLHRVLADDPFPDDVNGLYFGFLFPPPRDLNAAVAVFLSGSRHFGADRDWARKGEVPEDKFIDHSPMLQTAYRLIVSADAAAGAREQAIGFCHLFVSLVVAEWSCTIMRHTLRGTAPSRGLFVGIDPWRGTMIGTLEPDRPGGSGSIIVSWRGTVAGGARLAEWLSRVREFANWHDHRWNEVDEWEAQHAFLDERFGRASAMELGLRRLHLHFLVEADRAAEWFES